METFDLLLYVVEKVKEKVRKRKVHTYYVKENRWVGT